MRCYLDNDGVLADFDSHVLALFGKTSKELGDVELWRQVSQDREAFWSGIPVKDGAREIFELAKDFDPVILTGCPRDSESEERAICPVASSHKKKWVEKHFGPIPVITCFSRDKASHMSKPRDLLLDDTLLNIKRWQKAGGRTIWYQTAEQAISDLTRKLEYIRAQSA